VHIELLLPEVKVDDACHTPSWLPNPRSGVGWIRTRSSSEEIVVRHTGEVAIELGPAEIRDGVGVSSSQK
jgi:hypothetical protein